MRIFLTGGTGLLGNTILRQLSQGDHELISLVRGTPDKDVFADINTQFVQGDLSHRDLICQQVANCDAVIHCAGLIHLGWKRLEESMRVNRDGTKSIVDACLRHQVKLAHIGSTNTLAIGTRQQPADETTPLDHAGGQIGSAYVLSKRAGVVEVQKGIEQGLGAVILHPGFTLGPWDWKPSSGRMIVEVGKTWRPVAPSGGTSICDSRDVATGTITALQALIGGEIENGRQYILGGENWTYFDLWKEIAERMNRRPPVMRLGPVQRWLTTAVGEIWSKLVVQEPDINSAALKMSCQYHWYDCSRAHSELGYRSRSARESLDDAVRWITRFQHPAAGKDVTRG